VDRPQHDASRATAWCVVSSCEALRPAAFIVENVPEFLDWSLYPAWRSALEILGYHLTAQVLDAADYGVPQHRRRVFVIGHRGQPIAVESASQPHVPVADFIDWGDRYAWSLIDRPGRSPATLRRIAAGRAAHGSRFVAPYYGSGSGLSGRSVDRPIGTITTLDRWAVIDGERMRMLQPAELSTIMGFPADYQLAGNRRERIQLIGNAVCPPVGSAVISHVAQCLN
jgi:DNA (cytosine-5)-methyltransferase 1